MPNRQTSINLPHGDESLEGIVPVMTVRPENLGIIPLCG